MADTGYRPAPLVPLRTAQELKQATVRDYLRAGARMGITAPMSEVEKLAQADLEMVERYRRGIDMSPRPAKKKRESRAEKLILTPQEAANEPKLKAASKNRDRPDVLYANASKMGERWGYALGRLRRILEGAGRANTPEGVASTSECPDLALAVRKIHAEYLTRSRNHPLNRFAGLRDDEARRKLQRLIEDICDKSTGRLGPWWVPK